MKNLLTFFFICFSFAVYAQPEFFITDSLVTDCEGFLLDSELGDVPGTYDHNENYTFTICPEDADFIALNFQEFCTELLFDSLRVFDGADTLSTLLGGPYSGEPNPPQLIATSGCVTVNFISDPSVTCTGWQIFWTTDFIIPEPPVIQAIEDLACESNQITLQFDRNIHCDSLYPSAFSIVGPQFPNIINTNPLNCVNDSTNEVTLTFAPLLDFAGNYSVFFTQYIGACENVYELQAIGNFAVVNCPLNVILGSEGNISCAGDSTLLIAEASGGDATTYTYVWSPIFSDTSFTSTAVLDTTTYYVTVTDATGAMAVDSLTLSPIPLPVFGIPDTSLCQSDSIFFITALPTDGEWSGSGIIDETTGEYAPGAAEFLQDTIIYTATNGCTNELFINFIELDEGTDDAACIGAAPFQVSGGLPLGGIWSGENISSDGIFSPPDSLSSFTVTYTHPNGCSGTKNINIDSISLPTIDSLCQSEPSFLLAATPFGGIWSGPGIIDADTGEFAPSEANQGDNLLVYEIEGCTDSMTIRIKEINAGNSFSACPEQMPFVLEGDWYPVGGTWSGNGIIDPVAGVFDPSLMPEMADTLSYSVNGCTDSRVIYVFQTVVNIGTDTVYFCPEDEIVTLPLDYPEVVPTNGIWQGTGVQQVGDAEFSFSPALAGSGTHQLYYVKNECTDSITVLIHPSPTINEVTFCETETATALLVSPAGGTWEGTGIINPFSGVFDPTSVGAGVYTINNISEAGCLGSGDITVEAFVEAQLNAAESFYCYQNQNIDLAESPLGGVFTINEEIIQYFNPAQIGEGEHSITYSVGEGVCSDSETFLTTIGAPINLYLPFTEDSLCFQEAVTLSATASGGSTAGNFTYTWNQGLGFGQNHLVQPSTNTQYSVTVSDGCSDDAIGTIDLVVGDPIFVEFETQAPVCFDDTTSAEVFAAPGDNYTFMWSTIPPTESNFIESYPTSYTVTVTDEDSGCATTAFIDLPGYDLLEANFGIAPNVSCLTTLDPPLQILDFSVGGTSGYWLLGDSTNIEFYEEGEDLRVSFPDTGLHQIVLHLENEGGCISEHEVSVCIKAAHTLFAPNAFTPNGDGINDFFGFVGVNIESIHWQIYNRYGHLISEGNDLLDHWDGKYNGQRVQEGVYTFYAKYKAVDDAEMRELKGFVTVLK